VHTPLTQSEGPPQPRLVPQRTHAVVPPQSTSVSPPFFAPSLQAGIAHVAALQTALRQSPPDVHFLPFPHFEQLPPQS
jgi:hypothetical protein